MKKNQENKDENKVLRTYPSEINELLQIRMKEGKKLLDTQHTNYSYGTLEDVLNFGLDDIPLNNVKSVLLLGMGAGCVIGSLKNRYNVDVPTTAVEIDEVVVEIAAKEFNIVPSDDLKIIIDDAYDYVLNTKDSFDLVVLDIFIDLIVPEKFYSNKFWEAMTKVLNLNGFILFNMGIDLTEEEVIEFKSNLPACFLYQVIYNVYESNTLLIINKFCE